jgi:ABC-type transporter Mla MlaB component
MSGRLADEFVAEAKRVCSSAAAPLVIDVTELQHADTDGLALLATLIEGGARVENLSAYLAMRVAPLRERGGSEVRKRDNDSRSGKCVADCCYRR